MDKLLSQLTPSERRILGADIHVFETISQKISSKFPCSIEGVLQGVMPQPWSNLHGDLRINQLVSFRKEIEIKRDRFWTSETKIRADLDVARNQLLKAKFKLEPHLRAFIDGHDELANLQSLITYVDKLADSRRWINASQTKNTNTRLDAEFVADSVASLFDSLQLPRDFSRDALSHRPTGLFFEVMDLAISGFECGSNSENLARARKTGQNAQNQKKP